MRKSRVSYAENAYLCSNNHPEKLPLKKIVKPGITFLVGDANYSLGQRIQRGRAQCDRQCEHLE